MPEKPTASDLEKAHLILSEFGLLIGPAEVAFGLGSVRHCDKVWPRPDLSREITTGAAGRALVVLAQRRGKKAVIRTVVDVCMHCPPLLGNRLLEAAYIKRPAILGIRCTMLGPRAFRRRLLADWEHGEPSLAARRVEGQPT